jgi:NAD-dependent dihydropyrimidine dehydrogenase PreA subunit
MAKEKFDIDGIDGGDSQQVAVEEQAATPEKPAAEVPSGVDRDLDGMPYCVRHHCRMKQYSGRKRDRAAAHYVCPVPGCNETAKLVRLGQRSIPVEPMECPECRQRGEKVFLERMPEDRTLRSSTSVRLWCPHCEYAVGPLALPNQAAAYNQQVRRAAVGEIGHR